MSSTPLPSALAAALPTAPPALWRELVARYSEEQRHYHDVSHLEALDRHFAAVADGPGWSQPREVALAVLFHDAVYDCGASDNEQRSALLAREGVSLHFPDQDIDSGRVEQLILWTARHGRIAAGELGEDDDALHFLDADMAILGSSPQDYRRYESQVKQEYCRTLAAPLFKLGRKRFLKRLLKSERIFLSAFFQDRLEAKARANIQAALGDL